MQATAPALVEAAYDQRLPRPHVSVFGSVVFLYLSLSVYICLCVLFFHLQAPCYEGAAGAAETILVHGGAPILHITEDSLASALGSKLNTSRANSTHTVKFAPNNSTDSTECTVSQDCSNHGSNRFNRLVCEIDLLPKKSQEASNTLSSAPSTVNEVAAADIFFIF